MAGPSAGPPFWLLTLVDENERRVHPGQRVSSESIPVVIASDQSPIPITGSIVIDPDVNMHDGAGNPLTSQLNGAQRALDVGINVAGVQIDPRDIRLLTATDQVTVIQGTSPWDISATSLPLPTGAATSALQIAGNTSLASIDSKLTAPLVIRDLAFATDKVDVTGSLVSISGTVPISGSVTALQGTNPWIVDGSGFTQPISAAALPLPTGAATSALQLTGNASLASIDSKLTAPLIVSATDLDIRDLTFATDSVDVSGSSVSIAGTVPISGTITANQGTSPWIVDGSGFTQPISAASLPLPTGAATSALQTTANLSLASIDSKLTSPITVTPTSFFPVDQGQAALPSDAWYMRLTDGSSTVGITGFSLNVNVTRSVLPTGAATEATLSAINGKLNSLGQKTMANSVPVVIASDQSSLPVSVSGNVNNASVGTNNSTLPTSSTLIGGNDGTNIRPVDVRIATPSRSDVGLVARPLPFEPATFSLFGSNIAIGNNKSMIAIKNAGGSSVTIRIVSIKIINTQTTAVAGVVADFQVRRINSFTGGTALTPLTLDTTDSLNGSVTAATGATVVGEAAASLMDVQWSSDEWGVGTLDAESNDHAQQALKPFYELGLNQKAITLRAGQGLTIKQVTNSTAGTFDFIVLFTQE